MLDEEVPLVRNRQNLVADERTSNCCGFCIFLALWLLLYYIYCYIQLFRQQQLTFNIDIANVTHYCEGTKLILIYKPNME
jgi:hypothetical protein